MGATDSEMTLPKTEQDIIPDSMRYEYDPWLLDDHPLRSHPTVCIPGLGTFIAEWYASVERRWKDGLFRVGCILLACFAAFKCLQALPSVGGKGTTHPTPLTHHSTRDWHFTCTFPNPDPRATALAQSAVAGCEGFRTDIWLHGNELQMGPSDAGPKAINDMQNRLDSLVTKLGPRDLSISTDIQMPMNTESEAESLHEVEEEETSHSFWLVLDPQSSLQELYPYLVSHLDLLRQRGLLSHWNGARVVQRPFTVVVASESLPRSDCADHPYTDIFWASSEDTSSWNDRSHDHLIPICAV
ncbi:hypothetical protein N7509_001601 [Penicillium cosmopolitanum]|uniref:Uncharacterized protein n=1 Tax=Penicillium cosmopolitanum TaxID=1131564 RepID=A0A9W9W7G2_9EURO|nr:uncharacterized protein N7509_001601 [Penicillium cosmopolitanum]KAJ5407718.1 hypothetical protein N7509_001601 [Penicillium cosmopolitanum]